ncbi:hypothetical protein H2203_000320 [Taxawa tesnikishii (nom. ined.)]|nr:hypothetical protein H2203_000320 [Dothideales sp. JES 119]
MAAEGLSHNEIWDDSALVRSWNDALEEYKKYHSMAAKGEKVEEILDAAEQDGDVLSKAPDVDASTGLPKWEPDTEEQAMDTDNTTEDNATSAGAMPEQNAPATSIAPPGPPSAPMPQGLLSSGID